MSWFNSCDSFPRKVSREIGITTVETAIILPIIGLFVLAIIDASRYFAAKGLLEEGLRSAARVASFQDGNSSESLSSRTRHSITQAGMSLLTSGLVGDIGSGNKLSLIGYSSSSVPTKEEILQPIAIIKKHERLFLDTEDKRKEVRVPESLQSGSGIYLETAARFSPILPLPPLVVTVSAYAYPDERPKILPNDNLQEIAINDNLSEELLPPQFAPIENEEEELLLPDKQYHLGEDLTASSKVSYSPNAFYLTTAETCEQATCVAYRQADARNNYHAFVHVRPENAENLSRLIGHINSFIRCRSKEPALDVCKTKIGVFCEVDSLRLLPRFESDRKSCEIEVNAVQVALLGSSNGNSLFYFGVRAGMLVLHVNLLDMMDLTAEDLVKMWRGPAEIPVPPTPEFPSLCLTSEYVLQSSEGTLRRCTCAPCSEETVITGVL